MSNEAAGPAEVQRINPELDWLREVYRLIDPRSNRVSRNSLQRAFAGLDVEHLKFVRDLNAAILEDQLEVIGGCPESYEEIFQYTDHIVVDSFLAELIDDATENPSTVTPAASQSGHPSTAHAEMNRSFHWVQVQKQATHKARRTKRRRSLRHYVSKVWRRPSYRRLLKLLLVIVALAVIEQCLERYAPEPVGPWAQNLRREAVGRLVEPFRDDAEPTDIWVRPDLRGVSPVP